MTIRVVLPFHLRTLARIDAPEIQLEINASATLGSALAALESSYPVLRGAIRDHATLQRRPFVRFYAGKEDLSHEAPETPLPSCVTTGTEPLFILGAMAGG